MNFDEYIVNQIDKKYKEMLLGSNEKPKFPSIKSVTTYEDKKTEFFKRLNQEKNTFNNAIDTITKTRQDNLDEQTRIKEARRKAREEAERKRKQQEEEYNKNLKQDKKSILKLAIVIPLIVVLIALMAFFTIFKDANVWYKEVVVSEFGFVNSIDFFDTFSRQWGIGFYSFVTSIVLTIIGWIVVAIIVYVLEGSEGLGIVGAVFGIGLVVSLLSIIIPAVIIRVVLAILVHLIQYLLYPWVALCVVASMIIPLIITNLGMHLPESRKKSNIAFLPIIALGTALLCVYSSFAVSNNKEYYSHNGSGFESAFCITGGGTYNVDKMYYVYQNTYFKFVSEETADYTIEVSGKKVRYFVLYNEQKNKLVSYERQTYVEEENHTPFCYTFEANKIYYVKVRQYEKNYRYTLKIEKTLVCQ